jgi:hypothetical protein
MKWLGFNCVALASVMLTGCNGPYNLGPDALSSSDGVGMESVWDQPSDLNYPAGRYQSFADYMVQTDPELMKDAKSIGKGKPEALCVAEAFGRSAYGFDYEMLDAAVTGRSKMTRRDERRVSEKLEDVLDDAKGNPSAFKAKMNDMWRRCIAA